MNEKSRYEQYQICKERGYHSSNLSGGMVKGVHGFYTCPWCGVSYWEEVIRHESNIPEKQEENDCTKKFLKKEGA